ncbi:hypothetical protein ACUNER_20025 [Serratia sp. IR-2025]
MNTFIAVIAVWFVLAFAVVGWFAYRQCKCCRAFNQQCMPPELRNYD